MSINIAAMSDVGAVMRLPRDHTSTQKFEQQRLLTDTAQLEALKASSAQGLSIDVPSRSYRSTCALHYNTYLQLIVVL